MNSPNLDIDFSPDPISNSGMCSSFCTSDWREDWALKEEVLWKEIHRTAHFQALCSLHGISVEKQVKHLWSKRKTACFNLNCWNTCEFSKNLEFWSTHHELFGLNRSMAFETCYSVASDDSGYDTSPSLAPMDLPEVLDEPFPCTGLCGTDNYSSCPYCLILRIKVKAKTDIYSIKDRMLRRKALWESSSKLCKPQSAASVVSALIWSYAVPPELVFIPEMKFHGDTFNHFLCQIQRRIDTRQMRRVHQSLREAPLKRSSRTERFELNFKDECGDRERDRDFWRRFRSEEGFLLTLKYCRDHITDHEDHFLTPMNIPTSYVPEFDTNILCFYGKVRTRGKKWRSGEMFEEKRRRRKKSRERAIQRSNERLQRRKLVFCLDLLNAS